MAPTPSPASAVARLGNVGFGGAPRRLVKIVQAPLPSLRNGAVSINSMAESFRAIWDAPGVTKSVGYRPPLDRPTCSPCQLKFTAEQLDPGADIPYDTKRCDSECVGKWGTALKRFAACAFEQATAAVQSEGDTVVRLRLVSRGTEYTFELADAQGSFSWRGAQARGASKDGQLFVAITIGANGGLRQLPTGGLPRIQLLPGLQLTPQARTVAGQRIVIYESPPTHVRIYSKHRELRGDAPEEWSRYADPEPPHRPWEYLSGPNSRRLARWSGGEAMDVDESA